MENPRPIQKLVYRRVADLILSDRNPRTHSEAHISQLVGSIKVNGWTNPILIDENNEVISGNGRLRAAQKAALETVPTIVLEGLTDAQKAAYRIADNKLALNAGWDYELLTEELGWLEEREFDLTRTGFSELEIANFLEALAVDVISDDVMGDQEPAVPAQPSSDGSAAQDKTTTHSSAQPPADPPLPTQEQTSPPAPGTPPAPDPDWRGMPEFHQPDNKPFRTIHIHFNDQAAVDAFADLIGRNITENTKYLWYPAVPVDELAGAVYE